MSHLLYLHSFEVARFVSVFGSGNKGHIDALTKALPPAFDGAKAKQVVADAVNHGLDGKKRPEAEQRVLDFVVHHALSTKKLGIHTKPISPMGAGGGIFDELEAAFEEAGAKKLFEVLQRGRNYEGAYILLSPDDVALAAKQLRKVAEDDADGYLTSELLEPFAKAAKQGRAIYGSWG